MKIHRRAPILDDILERWRGPLGKDYSAYNNHCYRVLNFCLAFVEERVETLSKVSIAAAFHDMGIWSHQTFDYLEPSRRLAREYLEAMNWSAWCEEIDAMIDQHHKIRAYKSDAVWLVEPFRKADWVDVSRGLLNFGLPSAFVAETFSVFPNAGFHKRLIRLTLQEFKMHPLNPLPMMKL